MIYIYIYIRGRRRSLRFVRLRFSPRTDITPPLPKLGLVVSEGGLLIFFGGVYYPDVTGYVFGRVFFFITIISFFDGPTNGGRVTPS